MMMMRSDKVLFTILVYLLLRCECATHISLNISFRESQIIQLVEENAIQLKVDKFFQDPVVYQTHSISHYVNMEKMPVFSKKNVDMRKDSILLSSADNQFAIPTPRGKKKRQFILLKRSSNQRAVGEETPYYLSFVYVRRTLPLEVAKDAVNVTGISNIIEYDIWEHRRTSFYPGWSNCDFTFLFSCASVREIRDEAIEKYARRRRKRRMIEGDDDYDDEEWYDSRKRDLEFNEGLDPDEEYYDEDESDDYFLAEPRRYKRAGATSEKLTPLNFTEGNDPGECNDLFLDFDFHHFDEQDTYRKTLEELLAQQKPKKRRRRKRAPFLNLKVGAKVGLGGGGGGSGGGGIGLKAGASVGLGGSGGGSGGLGLKAGASVGLGGGGSGGLGLKAGASVGLGAGGGGSGGLGLKAGASVSLGASAGAKVDSFVSGSSTISGSSLSKKHAIDKGKTLEGLASVSLQGNAHVGGGGGIGLGANLGVSLGGSAGVYGGGYANAESSAYGGAYVGAIANAKAEGYVGAGVGGYKGAAAQQKGGQWHGSQHHGDHAHDVVVASGRSTAGFGLGASLKADVGLGLGGGLFGGGGAGVGASASLKASAKGSLTMSQSMFSSVGVSGGVTVTTTVCPSMNEKDVISAWDTLGLTLIESTTYKLVEVGVSFEWAKLAALGTQLMVNTQLVIPKGFWLGWRLGVGIAGTYLNGGKYRGKGYYDEDSITSNYNVIHGVLYAGCDNGKYFFIPFGMAIRAVILYEGGIEMWGFMKPDIPGQPEAFYPDDMTQAMMQMLQRGRLIPKEYFVQMKEGSDAGIWGMWVPGYLFAVESEKLRGIFDPNELEWLEKVWVSSSVLRLEWNTRPRETVDGTLIIYGYLFNGMLDSPNIFLAEGDSLSGFFVPFDEHYTDVNEIPHGVFTPTNPAGHAIFIADNPKEVANMKTMRGAFVPDAIQLAGGVMGELSQAVGSETRYIMRMDKPAIEFAYVPDSPEVAGIWSPYLKPEDWQYTPPPILQSYSGSRVVGGGIYGHTKIYGGSRVVAGGVFGGSTTFEGSKVVGGGIYGGSKTYEGSKVIAGGVYANTKISVGAKVVGGGIYGDSKTYEGSKVIGGGVYGDSKTYEGSKVVGGGIYGDSKTYEGSKVVGGGIYGDSKIYGGSKVVGGGTYGGPDRSYEGSKVIGGGIYGDVKIHGGSKVVGGGTFGSGGTYEGSKVIGGGTYGSGGPSVSGGVSASVGLNPSGAQVLADVGTLSKDEESGILDALLALYPGVMDDEQIIGANAGDEGSEQFEDTEVDRPRGEVGGDDGNEIWQAGEANRKPNFQAGASIHASGGIQGRPYGQGPYDGTASAKRPGAQFGGSPYDGTASAQRPGIKGGAGYDATASGGRPKAQGGGGPNDEGTEVWEGAEVDGRKGARSGSGGNPYDGSASANRPGVQAGGSPYHGSASANRPGAQFGGYPNDGSAYANRPGVKGGSSPYGQTASAGRPDDEGAEVWEGAEANRPPNGQGGYPNDGTAPGSQPGEQVVDELDEDMKDLLEDTAAKRPSTAYGGHPNAGSGYANRPGVQAGGSPNAGSGYANRPGVQGGGGYPSDGSAYANRPGVKGGAAPQNTGGMPDEGSEVWEANEVERRKGAPEGAGGTAPGSQPGVHGGAAPGDGTAGAKRPGVQGSGSPNGGSAYANRPGVQAGGSPNGGSAYANRPGVKGGSAPQNTGGMPEEGSEVWEADEVERRKMAPDGGAGGYPKGSGGMPNDGSGTQAAAGATRPGVKGGSPNDGSAYANRPGVQAGGSPNDGSAYANRPGVKGGKPNDGSAYANRPGVKGGSAPQNAGGMPEEGSEVWEADEVERRKMAPDGAGGYPQGQGSPNVKGGSPNDGSAYGNRPGVQAGGSPNDGSAYANRPGVKGGGLPSDGSAYANRPGVKGGAAPQNTGGMPDEGSEVWEADEVERRKGAPEGTGGYPNGPGGPNVKGGGAYPNDGSAYANRPGVKGGAAPQNAGGMPDEGSEVWEADEVNRRPGGQLPEDGSLEGPGGPGEGGGGPAYSGQPIRPEAKDREDKFFGAKVFAKKTNAFLPVNFSVDGMVFGTSNDSNHHPVGVNFAIQHVAPEIDLEVMQVFPADAPNSIDPTTKKEPLPAILIPSKFPPNDGFYGTVTFNGNTGKFKVDDKVKTHFYELNEDSWTPPGFKEKITHDDPEEAIMAEQVARDKARVQYSDPSKFDVPGQKKPITTTRQTEPPPNYSFGPKFDPNNPDLNPQTESGMPVSASAKPNETQRYIRGYYIKSPGSDAPLFVPETGGFGVFKPDSDPSVSENAIYFPKRPFRTPSLVFERAPDAVAVGTPGKFHTRDEAGQPSPAYIEAQVGKDTLEPKPGERLDSLPGWQLPQTKPVTKEDLPAWAPKSAEANLKPTYKPETFALVDVGGDFQGVVVSDLEAAMDNPNLPIFQEYLHFRAKRDGDINPWAFVRIADIVERDYGDEDGDEEFQGTDVVPKATLVPEAKMQDTMAANVLQNFKVNKDTFASLSESAAPEKKMEPLKIGNVANVASMMNFRMFLQTKYSLKETEIAGKPYKVYVVKAAEEFVKVKSKANPPEEATAKAEEPIIKLDNPTELKKNFAFDEDDDDDWIPGRRKRGLKVKLNMKAKFDSIELNEQECRGAHKVMQERNSGIGVGLNLGLELVQGEGKDRKSISFLVIARILLRQLEIKKREAERKKARDSGPLETDLLGGRKKEINREVSREAKGGAGLSVRAKLKVQIRKRRGEGADSSKEAEEARAKVLPGWKTQYREMTPNTTLIANGAIFYGTGNCKQVWPDLKEWNGEDPTVLIEYYLKVMRIHCMKSSLSRLHTLINEEYLAMDDRKKAFIIPNPDFTHAPRLTPSELKKLSLAFEFHAFTRVYCQIRDEGRIPEGIVFEPHVNISRSVAFLSEMSFYVIQNAFKITPRHGVRMIRNHLATLRTVLTKLHQDALALDAKCPDCTFDKILTAGDKFRIMSLIQFIIHGLGPFFKIKIKPRQLFKEFVDMNVGALQERVLDFERRFPTKPY